MTIPKYKYSILFNIFFNIVLQRFSDLCYIITILFFSKHEIKWNDSVIKLFRIDKTTRFLTISVTIIHNIPLETIVQN